MLEVRYFPSLRWRTCETQQGYRGQCWSFALEETV
ncbi:hypothetical protein Gotri_017476, partial [Gossypium trilobum]|nr:hypothetical protein [Gossypium trilobum]